MVSVDGYYEKLFIIKPIRAAKICYDAFANRLRWSTLSETNRCLGSGGATSIGHYDNPLGRRFYEAYVLLAVRDAEVSRLRHQPQSPFDSSCIRFCESDRNIKHPLRPHDLAAPLGISTKDSLCTLPDYVSGRITYRGERNDVLAL